MLGGRDRGQRIHLVVQARQRPFDAADLLALVQHVEGVVRAARLPLRARTFAAEAREFAPAALGQHALQAGLRGIHHQPAGGRHGAHQMMELPLDGREVVEDVGVVELEVVEDRRARAVVHELAALVEEGGVVLVGLDHEGRSVAEPGRDAEIERHPADQEARRLARALEHPGQHRGGGGLAVRAGHRHHVAAQQHVLGQPLRAAGVGLAGVEDGFHQRKLRRAVGQPGARHHVADHEHVGASASWSAPNPSIRSMPSARNWSLIGGYTPVSQPVTRWPASRARAARPPMNVPQMPRT